MLYDLVVLFNGDTLWSASQQTMTYDQGAPSSATTVALTATGSGSTIDVSGTLTASGVAVVGAALSVAVNGNSVGTTNPTASDGSFTFQLTGAPAGTDTVTVSFAGVTGYLASEASTVVNIVVGALGSSTGLVIGVAAAAALIGGVLLVRSRKKSRR